MATAQELSFAAAMKYREGRDSDRAKAISKISSASSSQVHSYVGALSNEITGTMSPDEALCVLIDGQLSMHQYNVVRAAAPSRFSP